MKRIMLIGFLLTVAQIGMAQERVEFKDPTYSESNYKHPHKAAFARANNLDRRMVLTIVSVTDNSNYKQPMTKSKMKKSASFSSGNGVGPATSYKHPYGLQRLR